MAPSRAVATLIATFAPHAVGAMSGDKHARESLVAVEMHMFRSDCGKTSVHRSEGESALFPGAGMDPAAVTPYLKVLKDGYYQVDCVKDLFFHSGDKFHDNKFEYDEAKAAGVSIVHYDSHVAKEDREPMSHKVCFEFCRTIQNMTFFGLQNGRGCYCAPFYNAIAGDSTDCDVPCPGNPTAMCGGNSKSSVFAMHQCADTAETLSFAAGKLTEMKNEMDNAQDEVGQLSDQMQTVATAYQKLFGAAGDPVASDLMQSAKVFAGELKEAANRGKAMVQSADAMATEAAGLKAFVTSEEVGKAEALMANMEEATAKGVAFTDELEQLARQADPDHARSEDRAEMYYNMMYFVDKAFMGVPATCGGDAAGRPMLATLDECARACDEDVHKCVGFSFMPSIDQSRDICFLLSKVKTAVYYAGCPAATPAFLQRENGEQPVCRLKFSKFGGAALKPDPSGKCGGCLTELTKADRCYK